MNTQALITVNGVAGSNDNVPLNTLVSLGNQGLGGESTYAWSIVTQPEGAEDFLSSTSYIAPTFTPTKEGTYLIRLVVNPGQSDQKSNKIVVAVRELQTGDRIPAVGETTENDGASGWAGTAINSILRRVTQFKDSGILSCVALNYLAIGYNCNSRIVKVWGVDTTVTNRHLATVYHAYGTDENIETAVLGFLVGDGQGQQNPFFEVPPSGIARILFSGPQTIYLPGASTGDRIYITDVGDLALVPGTKNRSVGVVLDNNVNSGADFYNVWFDGLPQNFQSLSVSAPLQNTGTDANPNISAVVGSTAGTLCAGNDARLSDTRTPTDLSPNPTGTYGSSSAVPVITVNSRGQVTSVTTQSVSGSGVTSVNVTAPITKTGTATSPTIGITLGTTASSACAGDDSRLSNARTPTGAAGGVLAGTYPNPNALGGTLSSGVYTINLSGNTTVFAPSVSGTFGNDITIQAGTVTGPISGTYGYSGSVILKGGGSPLQAGGFVRVYGGAGTTGAYSSGVEVNGGNSVSASYSGGGVSLVGGNGNTVAGQQSSGGSAGIRGGDGPTGGGIASVYGGDNTTTFTRAPVALWGSHIMLRGLIRLAGQVRTVTASTTITLLPTDMGAFPNIGSTYIRLEHSSSFTFTSAPTIATSFSGFNFSIIGLDVLVANAGMCVRLQNGSSTHSLTFQKDAALGGPLVGSALALKANTVVLLPRQILDFMWDGEYWVQVA